MWSLSYHAASGVIAVGLADGHIDLWQTAEYDSFDISAALQSHACFRTRLSVAQSRANDIQSLIEKADSELRQQMSREQELIRSIADLEEKCAHFLFYKHPTDCI